MTNKFCAFNNKDQKTIKEILQIAFDLKDSDFEKIADVYEVFTTNFNGTEAKEREIISKSKFHPRTENSIFKEIFLEESTQVGVDLPVSISPDNFSKTVFIVAEDPLRDAPYKYKTSIFQCN